MENKDATYYTPELEEFHIGFEFEYHYEEGKLITHPDNKKGWRKEVCDQDWTSIILDDYEHNQDDVKHDYRVKYLDREDIESLGWKHEKDHPSTSESFYSIDTWEWLGLDHNHKSQWIGIYFLYVEGNTTLFSGTINNKSEFKKLMKQLGI